MSISLFPAGIVLLTVDPDSAVRWIGLLTVVWRGIRTAAIGAVSFALALGFASAAGFSLPEASPIVFPLEVAVVAAVAVASAVAFALNLAVYPALKTTLILIVLVAVVASISFASEVVSVSELVVAVLVSIVVTSTGIYIAWQAMREEHQDAWIRSFAIAFAAINGTRFCGANLTDANFSSTKLKSTDMRGATLTRVRWHKAKMLDRVPPGNSYLQSTQVRQWLLGNGIEQNIDKNFDGQKLQGVNFQGGGSKLDFIHSSSIDSKIPQTVK